MALWAWVTRGQTLNKESTDKRRNVVMFKQDIQRVQFHPLPDRPGITVYKAFAFDVLSWVCSLMRICNKCSAGFANVLVKLYQHRRFPDQ